MQGSIGSTYYLELPKNSIDTCNGIECWFAVVSLETIIYVATFILAVVVLTAFPLVKLAMARLGEERDRTRAERDAFGRFLDRIATISPMSSVQTTAGQTADLVTAGMADSIGSVERAYRDTVMAVDHYDEEYAEPFLENVAEEFGPDVARAVSSNTGVSPPLQQLLLGRAKTSKAQREELLHAIDTELEELREGHHRLADIERRRRSLRREIRFAHSFDETADAWFGLAELERECDRLATDRQRSVQEPPLETSGIAFHAYLYQTIEECTHPLLAETARLVDRIRADRDAVFSRLSTSS